MTISPAGQDLVDRATVEFEAEVAVLVAGLSSTQRDRLSAGAGRVVATDARRRGIDIFDPAARIQR